jgi:hypothetical protein
MNAIETLKITLAFISLAWFVGFAISTCFYAFTTKTPYFTLGNLKRSARAFIWPIMLVRHLRQEKPPVQDECWKLVYESIEKTTGLPRAQIKGSQTLKELDFRQADVAMLGFKTGKQFILSQGDNTTVAQLIKLLQKAEKRKSSIPGYQPRM